MAEFPGFTLWTDAYLGDTGHLTTLEHGTYLLLLIAMWRAGGSLPNDEVKLAKFAHLTGGQWQRIRATIMEFFTAGDGQIRQSRLTAELEFVRQRSRRQSDNAKAKVLKSQEPPSATAQPNASQTAAPTLTLTPTLREESQTDRSDHVDSSVGRASPKRASAAKGTRLPRDWVLPKAWGDWALATLTGISVEFIRAEAESFRDYWVPKVRDATKLDWELTWHKWVRTAWERAKPRGSPARGETVSERRGRELAERIEREHGIKRQGGSDPADHGHLAGLIEERR